MINHSDEVELRSTSLSYCGPSSDNLQHCKLTNNKLHFRGTGLKTIAAVALKN